MLTIWPVERFSKTDNAKSSGFNNHQKRQFFVRTVWPPLFQNYAVDLSEKPIASYAPATEVNYCIVIFWPEHNGID